MPHHTPLIAILAAGFVLAFLLGALAHRLRLSPLVGYLLAGVAIGPFTPGFVADQALAVELSEIGVILLMFGVGLHFSIDDLLKVKHIAVPGAIVQIGVATALGWGLAAWLGWPTVQGLVFGLALSVASTVVLLRAMEDRRLLDTPRGRIAVGWLIVEDLVMVLALVVLPALAEGMGEGGEAGGGGLLLALAITLAKVMAFVALMLIVGRRLIPWVLERVSGTGSRELFTLCILAIALGIAFGSAHLFGVSFALGAFFAGMLLNESELSHEAANDSLPMRDAFAVLFFVSVGMLFDPSVLLSQPLLVLLVLLIIVFGKSVAAYAIVRAFGHPRGTALTISASLAQIGEFSFILAGLGVSLSLLPAQGRDLILAGAILSIIANPFLFVLLDRAQARAKARAEADAAAGAPPPAVAEVPPGPPLVAEDHVIVVGFGRVGSHLAALLQQRHINLVVIDTNPYHIERAHRAGFPAIRGNAATSPVLAEARVDCARLAVIAVAQALEAGEIVDRLREANPGITVFARAHSDAEVKHLLDHGADGAVLAERELACSMAEMILATPPYRTSRAAPLALGA